MSTDTLFLERISTLKRRVLIRTFHRIIVIALLIFLCLYAMAAVLEKTGIFPFREYRSFYGISLVLSLILSLIYVYVTKEGFMQILIDIDTRLQLKDRISTAYEYHKWDKQSEFTDLLIEDAGRKLSELSNRQLFPPKLSLVYLVLSLLMVVNLLLFFADHFHIFSDSKQMKVDQKTSKTISALLQDYTKKVEEQTKLRKETPKTLHKKLEAIAKELEEQKMTQKELSESLDNMLKEAQGTKERLTNEIGSKLLDLKNIANLPIREVPQLRRLSANDLRELRKRMNEMFDNQIPESLEYDLDRLEEQQELEELLEQIRDETGSDHLNESTSDDEQETAQGENDSEKEGEVDSNHGTGNNQDSSDSEQGEEDENATGADFGWERGRGLDGESEDPYGRLDDDEGDSSVGHGRGGDTRQSPYELDRSNRAIFQDKMISNPKDEYNVHIRALTTIGNATLLEEDLTRPYQQELEEILQKEDIPLNYREYIKNYFISIGLRKERSDNGNIN